MDLLIAGSLAGAAVSLMRHLLADPTAKPSAKIIMIMAISGVCPLLRRDCNVLVTCQKKSADTYGGAKKFHGPVLG